MTPASQVVGDTLERALHWPGAAVHFVLLYGPNPYGLPGYNVHHFIVGLDDDAAAGLRMRGALEAAYPGEVRAWVLGRSEWERMAADLDNLILEGFQQGTPLYDQGEWRRIAVRLQALADAGQIVKTRFGWRRPGDAPRDTDAELLAELLSKLRSPRRGL